MPHHIDHGDNVRSQPGRVTPDNQSGSLCLGSDTSQFESVDSDKEGILSNGASDDSCVQNYSKFG